jgi:hypothetical protein
MEKNTKEFCGLGGFNHMPTYGDGWPGNRHSLRQSSMMTLHPFATSWESILPIWSHAAQMLIMIRCVTGFPIKEPGPGIKVMAKKAEEDVEMDVDDAKNEEASKAKFIPHSPATSVASSTTSVNSVRLQVELSLWSSWRLLLKLPYE